MNYSISSVKDIENCPGFGFRPSEDCLVNYYLDRKNSGRAEKKWPILEIDLCAFEPWDLLQLSTGGCDDYKYFFHRRQYADETKKSYKRRTKTGYWKSTGNPRKMKGGSTKRSLVFNQKESVRGSKEVPTGWIIQEYDNGGEYVIAKLQIKYDMTKKRKLRRRQNVSTNDFTEDNQIVHHNSEVRQNVSTNDFTEDNQIVRHNSEVRQNVSTNDFTEENQIVHHNSEVQNVSTDDTEDNPTDYLGSEYISGFEDQNQEMMVMTDHNEGEISFRLMGSVYNENSFSTESGGEYQSPAISSDLENYNQNEMTANYSASQNAEVVLPHFIDQNGENMNNTGNANCQESFSYETENQFSSNESEGEWSPIPASPYSNFPNEDIISSPGSIYWSLHNDQAATNFEQSDWWSNMPIFNYEGETPVSVEQNRFSDFKVTLNPTSNEAIV